MLEKPLLLVLVIGPLPCEGCDVTWFILIKPLAAPIMTCMPAPLYFPALITGLNDVMDRARWLWLQGMWGWSSVGSWALRGVVPKACLVTPVKPRQGWRLQGVWCRKWPLCEFSQLSWKWGGVPGKWKGFTCFGKSYQSLHDRLLQGSPGISSGQKERQERGGKVRAGRAELHPNLPTSKEECVIITSRGERGMRG